jgi:hypothetical protein
LYSIDFQFCNTKQNKKTNHDRDGTQLLGGHGKVSLSFCFVGKDKDSTCLAARHPGQSLIRR